MKKLVSLILALAMVFAMAVCATATTPETFPAMKDTGTITIKKATAGTTYTLYRILDIAKVDEVDGNVYILNDKWDDFIKTTDLKLSGNYVKGLPDNTLDAQKLAEAVVEYTKEHPEITNDGSSKMIYSGDHSSSNLRQYGYYVMVSDREGSGVKYTVFAIDKAHVEVEEKNVSEATLEKFVQEDSKMSDANNGWGEKNAAEIAQPVNFKIVVTLAPGTEKLVIEDTMPNFRDIDENTFRVEYSGGDIAEGTAYTKNINDATQPGVNTGFTVELMPDFRKAVEDGDTLTITYDAKLRYTAVVASTGNVNTANLKVNDVVKSTDTTTTYTYKLNVEKVDEAGKPLAGATFQLTHKGVALNFMAGTNNVYYVAAKSNETVDEITTDPTGKFSICGLDTEDEYILTETDAPTGYILMDDETFVISTGATTDKEITVTNLPGVVMPDTGGMGTTLFYVLGAVLACGATVLLVTKKRMSAN